MDASPIRDEFDDKAVDLEISEGGTTVGKPVTNSAIGIALDQDDDEGQTGCCGRQAVEPPPQIPLRSLLTYVPEKRPLMILGTICGMIEGTMLPAFSVVFGEMFNVFTDKADDASGLKDSLVIIAVAFIALAFGNLLFSYLALMSWGLTGEAVGRALRQRLFAALVRQEPAYFDMESSSVIMTRLGSDVSLIVSGVGDKVGSFVIFFTQTLVGIGVAFFYSWKLTLVLLAVSPVMAIAGALQARFIAAGSAGQSHADAQASIIADETINGFRTVLSFVFEERQVERYLGRLRISEASGSRKAHMAGLGLGASMWGMFIVYAIGFWYGGTLVADKELSVGDLLKVFFAIVIAAMGMGQAGQFAPDFARARGAAYQIIETINREPLINPLLGTGESKEVEGNIVLDNVHFSYPSRPDQVVLSGLNMEVRSGQVVALVGPSGSGKSTVINLIERFYDAVKGSISVDGVPVTEWDLHALRSQMALVAQEPLLFDDTIMNNIRYGKPDATEDEIFAAARSANAHDFIMGLDDGYNTRTGEKGGQLSGGQKQRVAIARAILRDPRILLLDEATSALDAESEGLVQEALEHLMEGRTTIVVAHRLSTIRDADFIGVMQNGVLQEWGPHDELIHQRGLYYALMRLQTAEVQAEADDADVGPILVPAEDVSVEVVSGKDASEEVVSGKDASEEVVSGKDASEEVMSGKDASEEVVSGKDASEEVISGKDASEEVAGAVGDGDTPEEGSAGPGDSDAADVAIEDDSSSVDGISPAESDEDSLTEVTADELG